MKVKWNPSIELFIAYTKEAICEFVRLLRRQKRTHTGPGVTGMQAHRAQGPGKL